MRFVFRYASVPHRRPRHGLQSRRSLVDIAAIKWVRDRGLDHAVEKESNLKPMLNLKNLIKSEPAKSLPLSLVAQNREALGIRVRPIEFVRKYPSVFVEFLPGGIGIHSHVKLTPEILDLDAEEQLIYRSDDCKQQAADRLLKLLMLARINTIPLHIVDRLAWDLGLPQDYTNTIVPEFPDYFKVTSGHDLELVCWSNDLAVSVMEKKAMSSETGYEKGMPIAFALSYSRGFEIDKKFKKWVDGWQKLPYISPYENASHLQSRSEESDKWASAILHELLHLFVPKKTDRESILCLGEYLGIRSRFKRALLHHPGIFYLSSKIGTHTVVLREAYKRDLLAEKHPLMEMRYKYIHLMNKAKEVYKPKSGHDGSSQLQMTPGHLKGGGEVGNDESEKDENQKLHALSDCESEDNSDVDYGDSDEEDEDSNGVARKNVATKKGKTTRKTNFEAKLPMRKVSKRSFRGERNKTTYRSPPKFSKRMVMLDGHNATEISPDRSAVLRTRGESTKSGRRASTL